jgi:hypothetical protein
MIAFRAKGAYGTGTTSCVAAVPTGGSAPQANDILLIVVESSDSTTAAGTPNTPANWTKIFEETQGNGVTGVTTLTIFGKRAGAGEANVTIDGVLNHCSATMLVYSGCVKTGTAWVAGTGNGADTGNGTLTGVTTPEDNCMVVGVCATTRDANATTTFSGWTNANLTSINEREDNTTSSGAGGGFGTFDGFKASAGATGNSTVTLAVSSQWRAVHITLKPDTSIVGTATITQASDSSSASGALPIKSIASMNQAANTATSTGAVSVKGSASVTQSSNTLSSDADLFLSGNGSLTQSGNSMSSEGALKINSLAVLDQGGDTLSAYIGSSEPEPDKPKKEHEHQGNIIHWRGNTRNPTFRARAALMKANRLVKKTHGS